MPSSMDRSLLRIGAVAAVVGAVLLFVSTLFHPLEADPNDALAAFEEYAADRFWIATHVGQFLGFAFMVAALVAFSRTLAEGAAGAWSRIGMVGAVASLAVAAALPAVDGIALKSMVDAWAAAPAEQQQSLFYAAFGVRQIEAGLASMGSLLLGLTVTVYGIAILLGRTYPHWLGWVGIISGVGNSAAGVVLAYTGFSGLMMAINMPASLLLLLWMIAVGVFMWRLSGFDSAA